MWTFLAVCPNKVTGLLLASVRLGNRKPGLDYFLTTVCLPLPLSFPPPVHVIPYLMATFFFLNTLNNIRIVAVFVWSG